MWEIDLSGQVATLLMSIIIGAAVGIVFDTLSAVERKLRMKKQAVFLLDMLFFCVLALFEFCFFLVTGNGEIRGFVFLGELIGFILFRLLFSRIYALLLSLLLSLLDRLFRAVKRLIFVPVSDFFEKICEFAFKISKKCGKFAKKLLKIPERLVYTKEKCPDRKERMENKNER